MSRSGPQSPTLATRLISTLVITEAVHFFTAIAMESWHLTAFYSSPPASNRAAGSIGLARRSKAHTVAPRNPGKPRITM